jgi:hypothetical protein
LLVHGEQAPGGKVGASPVRETVGLSAHSAVAADHAPAMPE